MILWFVDRFGLPGKYYTVWLILLQQSGIDPKHVRTLSLHQHLRRQLLTKYAARKAPTWIPETGPLILETIDKAVESFKPEAVVLASPESLACLGLNPEFATLHNLRGSVYWRSDVPHIVTLPMSAWHSLVSQREIGAANYGYESPEDLSSHTLTMRADKSGIFGVGGGDAGGQEVHADLPDQLGGDASGITTPRTGTGALASGDVEQGLAVRGKSGPEQGPEGVDSDEDGLDDDSMREDADAVDAESDGPDADGDADADGTTSDGIAESEGPDDDDGTADQFFYEPVLSPVGRFAITADVQKLKRILDSGRNASGPHKPITLRYR